MKITEKKDLGPLIEEIEKFQSTSALLEPNIKSRASLFNSLNNYVNRFYGEIENNKAWFGNQTNTNFLEINSKNNDFESVLQIYKNEVEESGLNPASGGHLGYIPGGGIFLSAVGDFIADISNEYAGMRYGSPGAVGIETACINWLKEVFEFPESSIGTLTSGGSIANLIGLTAARDLHEIKNEKIVNSVVYLGNQTHHCVMKALRIIGLEDVQMRYIKLDQDYRIDTNDLNSQIEKDKANGLHPFLVIASAGTTDTGAIDPLNDIGEICKSNNLWYHIDAAYGGFFKMTSKGHLFKGIEKADSLVVDPHKGLFLPYGTGAVLVKNKKSLYHSHHYVANYMKDAYQDGEMDNPADISPELTRHFRGMRMWLPLQILGAEPFVAGLEEKLSLTQYFWHKIQELGFRVSPNPDLSVCYFYFPINDLETQNKFNEKLLKEVLNDGRVFFSSTTINDQFVIRIAVLSIRTKLSTIDLSLEIIENLKKKLSQEFNIEI